ncbi:hypothetical protein BKH41_02255 [Helicobacter sp. 12S02232-10]|uniref:hypothetical protein n=1 Tax=Helicobacter sp. 12S02232-10 TaxID=1476197 RepID=UPI000BA6ABAD|nr:hypothetical protein [Helicobacter sp. 12S02232-10]PAF49509.1 hypothetical protein BKH41_02255 [Helicobacter sp. 12S02232-10]
MQEIDMVAKAFNDSVFFHSFFMYFMPIPFLINLYTLFAKKNYTQINRKIWFVMPMIFFLVAVAFFSGIFVMAMQHFHINAKIILMIVTTLFIFVGEIIRIKKLKISKTNEKLMQGYLKFCKILYGADLILCILIILMGKF